MNRERAEREAAYIFGRPAVAQVKEKLEAAGSPLMNAQQSKQVHEAMSTLITLLKEPLAAVAYGQTLPPDIQQAVIYMWLGYGKRTLAKLGLIEK